MAFKLRSSNPVGTPLTWNEVDNNFSYLLTNMSGSSISLLGPSSVTGSLTLSGSSTILTLFGTASVNNIVPYTNNIYNLGSSGIKWNTVYATTFTGTAYTASNITPAIVSDNINSMIISAGGGKLTTEANVTTNGDTITINSLNLQQGDAVSATNTSHAEGSGTTANGTYSHAEGSGTIASGYGSHTEGENTTTSGSYSHAEGSGTIARGSYSHAEGLSTISYGDYSHAEGASTTASGSYSHAEGSATTARGSLSHAEGISTLASGTGSHAEGNSTISSGNYSHAEGYATQATKDYSHAEGYQTQANGNYSHTDGYYTITTASGSYAGGAYASASHAYEWARSNSNLGQYGTITLSRTTTNNTLLELSIGGSSADYFTIPAGSAYYIDLTVMGLTSALSSSVWNGKGVIKNYSGTTSLDSDFTMNKITGSWTLYGGAPQITADDTNDRIAIKVSGQTSTTVTWFAKADYIKIG